MKKIIAAAAAAAALTLTASPAEAQVTVAGDDNTAAQFVDALQVQVAVGVHFGDQNAAASDGREAEATNELSITQNQANAGLGEISDLNQGVDFVGDLFFTRDAAERGGLRTGRGPTGSRPLTVLNRTLTGA